MPQQIIKIKLQKKNEYDNKSKFDNKPPRNILYDIVKILKKENIIILEENLKGDKTKNTYNFWYNNFEYLNKKNIINQQILNEKIILNILNCEIDVDKLCLSQARNKCLYQYLYFSVRQKPLLNCP